MWGLLLLLPWVVTMCSLDASLCGHRVALMNLEHQYGDETTLAAVFTRALQHNEPLMVYKQMVTVQSLSAPRQQLLTLSSRLTAQDVRAHQACG